MKNTLPSRALKALFATGLVATGLLASSNSILAADHPVTCSGSNDQVTVQSAVNGANPGDTITLTGNCDFAAAVDLNTAVSVSGGTITGVNNSAFNFNANGASVSNTAISCNAVNGAYAISINSGSTYSTLDNVTISNCQRGVSLHNGASQVVIKNSNISDNNHSPGNNAGLWADFVSDVEIDNCQFNNHTGMPLNFTDSQNITIKNSSFDNNGSGLVFATDTNVSIKNIQVTNAGRDGIYISNSNQFKIDGLTGNGNRHGVNISNNYGGPSAVTITNSDLTGFGQSGINAGTGSLSTDVEVSNSNVGTVNNTDGTFNINITTTTIPAVVRNPLRTNHQEAKSAPDCTDLKPEKAPELFQMTRVSPTSVTLYWSPVNANNNGYVIAYGEAGTNLQHSVKVDQHDQAGVNNFTINDLIPGQAYFFTVRGQNGCATGDWSNELGLGAYRQQLETIYR